MIIQCLTDDDLYKFSQQQAAWRQYPQAKGRYELAVRTMNPAFPLADIVEEVRDEINSFENLVLTNDEYVHFQKTMPWVKNDYLDWLANFRYNPSIEAKIMPTATGGISASFFSPEWHRGILYEVKALAVIEELYCRKAFQISEEDAVKLAIDRLNPKIEMLGGHPRLMFTDFGTRRRFSRAVHKAVLKHLKDNCPNLIGTSNVWLARELGLKAIGTVAHEWFMAHLALVDRLELAQKRALHVWQQEYGENLGTALTDTFTTAAFWRDFDPILSKGFSGVRQDSGDPFKFGWDAIGHYKGLGIDPRTKSIIFSDSLDFQKMVGLFEEFVGLIGVGFGIGTNLTNDLGFEALSIVIKLMELNGVSLVKLSDVAGKTMGDRDMTRRVMEAYGVKGNR